MSDQAVKIFEALSDVDEELLERCNRKTVRKNDTTPRLFQAYGRAIAAGICLIVAGAVSWGGYQLIRGSSQSNSSGGAYRELADMAQSVTVEEEGQSDLNGSGGLGSTMGAGAEPAAGMAEDTGAATTDGMMAAQESATSESLRDQIAGTPAKEEAVQEGGQTEADKEQQADHYGDLREQQAAQRDSREEIPWEEACATEPFGSYLPTVLPDAYEAFSARRSLSTEHWDNLIFRWTDGVQVLSLDMTSGEVVTREDLERRDGLCEYVAEDFSKELMPDPPAGEPLAFTLYYADGMRIDFQGHVTADEMWAVVESIKKQNPVQK